MQTVGHYVQELQSVGILQQYSQEVQSRIDTLAGALSAIIAEWVEADIGTQRVVI